MSIIEHPNRKFLPPSVWTEEKTAQLKKLQADGDSAAEIAGAMGMTRNAVLGKLQRLGMAEEFHPVWTEESTAELIKLWCEGLSYRQIGARLGLSRNTVMGKGQRLRLSERYPRGGYKPPQPKRTARAADADRSAKQRIAKVFKVRATHGRTEVAKSVVREEAPPPPDFLGIALIDLEHGMCRFPRGGDGEPFIFCGQKVISGESWCPNCYRRVFQPPRTRTVDDAERARMAAQTRKEKHMGSDGQIDPHTLDDAAA